MDPLAVITILAARGVSDAARSALPDAPVVISAGREATAVRSRAALAGALHRLADIVAPPRATICAQ